MGVKILLADDSPTILKVVKIILAKEPFEVVECAREVDLSPRLAEHHPQLVFLDFNFSETRTGYDLCRDIKAKVPSCKVLMMYATFDTVDENVLRECGADAHVVKPFDSNRFIFQVRGLAEDSKPESDSNAGWTVRETVERQSPDIGRMTNETVDQLDESLSDWGMAVPGVIGKSDGVLELPPVIQEVVRPAARSLPPVAPSTTVTEAAEAPVPPAMLPDEDDLAYPDLGRGQAPKSKLVPLNELVLDVDTDETAAALGTLELMNAVGMDDDGVKHIENQIRDELEADLWKVDTFEGTGPRPKLVGRPEHVEEEPLFTAGQTYDENMFAPLDTGDRFATATATASASASASAPSSMDLESLKPMIRQLVEEAVREYCREQVERTAWEVIPDLAENLIKKELRELAQKVTREG